MAKITKKTKNKKKQYLGSTSCKISKKSNVIYKIVPVTCSFELGSTSGHFRASMDFHAKYLKKTNESIPRKVLYTNAWADVNSIEPIRLKTGGPNRELENQGSLEKLENWKGSNKKILKRTRKIDRYDQSDLTVTNGLDPLTD